MPTPAQKGRAPFHAGSLYDPSPGGFCLGYHGHYSRVGMGGRGPRDLSGPPKHCLSSWEPWCQQLECELCGPQQLLRHGLHSPAFRPHEGHQGATGEADPPGRKGRRWRPTVLSQRDLCWGTRRARQFSCDFGLGIFFSCNLTGDPMDCSRPGSSVHGISQARGLEWGCHLLLHICTTSSLSIHLWMDM